MSDEATLTLGEVVENRNCAPGHFQMGIRLPLSFADPTPGQFVMVRSAGHREPLLARPLSVFGYERYRGYGMLALLYRVVGEGTALLSRMQPGDPLSVLGPLGTGFSWSASLKRAVLVAGGIGSAPLIYLMKQLVRRTAVGKGTNVVFYLGAQTETILTGLDHLEGACELRICTDDGSRGTRGLVTEVLQREIGLCDPSESALFACGPSPMVRALASLLPAMPFPCQASLEERMACGLGACLGCAVAVRNENGTIGYQRVCKDGPVFDLRKICPSAADGIGD